MGDNKLQQDVGLFMLGTSGAVGMWALFNQGFFELIQKGVSTASPTEDEIRAINLSMNIGLGATFFNGLAVFLASGSRGIIPALGSGATGVALYLVYSYLLGEAIKPGVPSWATGSTG